MQGSQRNGTKEQPFLWEQPCHAENHETSFAAISHHKYFLKLKSVREALQHGIENEGELMMKLILLKVRKGRV